MPKSTRLPTLLLGFCLLVVAGWIAQRWFDDGELDISPGQLPYRARSMLQISRNDDPGREYGHLIVPSNADSPSRLSTFGPYSLISRIRDGSFTRDASDRPLPSRYQAHGWDCSSSSLVDLDGDGVSELLAIYRHRQTGQCRLLVWNSEQETWQLDCDLPSGPDRNTDGEWDGFYKIIGPVPTGRTNGGVAVALACDAAYDWDERGVLAIETVSGKRLWRYATGPGVYDACLADVCGDSTMEILLTTSSPDNAGRPEVNGTSSSRCYLAVLDARGDLLWQKTLSDTCQYVAFLKAADFRGDGKAEVVTATHNSHPSRPPDRVSVWAGDTGALLESVTLPAPALGLGVWTGRSDSAADVFVGTRGGGVLHYEYSPARLELSHHREAPDVDATVLAVGDLLPRAGVEVAVGLSSGYAWLLGGDLKPLLVDTPREHNDLVRRTQYWLSEGADPALILDRKTGGYCLEIVAEPFWSRQGDKASAGLLASLGIFLLAIGLARERRATLTKDELNSLWQAITPSSGRGHIKAETEMSLVLSELRELDKRRSSVQQLSTSVIKTAIHLQTETLPGLDDTLTLARRGGLLPVGLSAAMERVQRAVKLVIEADKAGGLISAKHCKEALDALQVGDEHFRAGRVLLQAAIEDCATADFDEVLELILRLHERSFREVGVTVALDLTAAPQPRHVILPATDLKFVLDNLVVNSTRAICENAPGHLTITAQRNDKYLAVSMADTGPGVRPEIRDNLFREPVSSRHGGGNGLWWSHKFISRWGGTIELAESTIGGGARFEIRLLLSKNLTLPH